MAYRALHKLDVVLVSNCGVHFKVFFRSCLKDYTV